MIKQMTIPFPELIEEENYLRSCQENYRASIWGKIDNIIVVKIKELFDNQQIKPIN